MSADQTVALVPEWTQGDRLRKARALTGMTVREFAAHIGVSHGTVTSAETDARAVRPITLKAWALATNVSQSWLEHGHAGANPEPPKPGQRNEAALAALIEEKRSRTRAPSTNRGYSTPAFAAA